MVMRRRLVLLGTFAALLAFVWVAPHPIARGIASAAPNAPAAAAPAPADDFRARAAAAKALGTSGRPDAMAELEKMLGDPHPSVRAAAASALAEVGDPAAVPRLRTAAKRESSPAAKAAMKAAADRLVRQKPKPARKRPVRTKVLVAVGLMENRSGVGDRGIAAALGARTRENVAAVPGVELLADGTDPLVTRKNRRLPVVGLDGRVTRLSHTVDSGVVTYSAEVEYSVHAIPGRALRARLGGSAQASTGTQRVLTPREHAALQVEAVAAAVESAVKNAGPALEAAAK